MNEIKSLLPYLKMWSTYVDIGIIAFILYKIIALIQETRAEQLIKGLIMLIIATKLSEVLGLHTVYWLLKNAMTVGAIAILIIFQPELRRALEHIGRGRFFSKGDLIEKELEVMFDEIITAVSELAKTRTGAIIILEQEIGLNEYIDSGTKIDASISAQLLINIFVPNTPLHDGAVILRKNRILAAGCFLPLTESQHFSKNLGTRHRASVGVSEISDSLVIVISEETGVISLAMEGKLSRFLDPKSLKEMIKSNYKLKGQKPPSWIKWGAKSE